LKLRKKVKILVIFTADENTSNHEATPAWLEMERESRKGKVLSLPRREYITIPIQEQLIVELYSK